MAKFATLPRRESPFVAHGQAHPRVPGALVVIRVVDAVVVESPGRAHGSHSWDAKGRPPSKLVDLHDLSVESGHDRGIGIERCGRLRLAAVVEQA